MDIHAINSNAGKRCTDSGDASILPARKKPRPEGEIGNGLSRTTSFSYGALRHEDYTVGWVTALPIELAAASAMLDSKHPRLPTVQGDDNYYRFGSIGPHNIVIACLPSGRYGTKDAAVVANNMARSFPSISIRLMVGIGGGVPKSDIRLGDVVVGHDVLQYDFGKTVRGGEFTCTSHPVSPPHQILTALSDLRAEHEQSPSRIPSIISEMLCQNQDMINYGYPRGCRDRLFDAGYEHSDETQECGQCDQTQLIHRPVRPSNETHIHYGAIASGNQVMKHAASRDRWASRNNILCFEMEAAGLIDHFPCLVIRGICDYCDSHKNKTWQKYAAATAAAFAKEFLQSIHPASDLTSGAATLENYDSFTPGVQHDSPLDSIKKSRKEKMASLKFEQIDNRRMNIKKAHLKTCKWMLKKEEYLDWLDEGKLREHGGFLWIKGKPGAGKSTMMKFISDASQKKKTHFTTLDFFFNARGHDMEKSTTGLYQSILFQLLTKIPALQDILDCSRLFSNGTPQQWTNDLLKELIERAIEKLKSSVLCYIDALDECHDDQIRDMISFFERLGQLAMSTGVGLYVCFSSRHYPHISMREGLGLEIILEKQQNHGDDIREYVNSELAIGHGKLADEIKSEVLDKSSGVFMWAVLVVKILNEERDRGRKHKLRQKLREIPKDLHELFRSILFQDHHNNREELLLCFQWILFARRPLTLLELHVAILSQTDDPTQIDPEDLTDEDSRIFLLESSKGLAEVANSKNPTVQLIHESVKDFLLKDNGLRSLINDFDNFPGESHTKLRDCCCLYVNNDMRLLYEAHELDLEKLRQAFPFLEYAVSNLLFHADAAGSFGIKQLDFVRNFPDGTWIHLHNVFEKFKSRRYKRETKLAYILAEANASSLVEECIPPQNFLEIGLGRYGCPLLAAMVHGNRKVVEVFRHKIASTLPVDDLAENEATYYKDNLKVSKISRDFTFASSGRSLLSFLAEYGDVDLLLTLSQRRSCLQLPSAPPDRHYSHRSAIFYAADNSHWQIVKLLSETGQFDLPIGGEWNWTLLHHATLKGHVEVVKILLATGQVEPDSRNAFLETPLSVAAECGHMEVMKILLATSQVKPDSKDNTGRTPLSHAASSGHLEVIKILLATGQVKPDSKDNTGRTPLSHAASSGHLEVVKILLATGQVEPDSKDNVGRTPLSYASQWGHEPMNILLATGRVEPDSKDNIGRTPLSYAASSGHLEGMKILLATGNIDTNSRSTFGTTPLAWAAEYGREDSVSLLLKMHEVDPNSRDCEGYTPLLAAVRRKQWSSCLKTMKTLLESDRVDRNARNDFGETTLSILREIGHGDDFESLCREISRERISLDAN
ncbi:unnamed protein product [Clonostachys rosea]|uniref:NACHT domain-containing protein n=1 Tax=Bionectria ochroleuca TaxID=29856 RepID=A0ABY6U7S4_BIOOC|nr:unnamed protein product [Clonostachys rosea]